MVVSVARHYRATLRSLGLARVCSIPNPVDLTRFRPGSRDSELVRKLRIAAEDVVVLHASNLSPVKRVLDVVAATELAWRRGVRVRTLVLGDGLQRANAEELCRRRRLTDRIRFLGWIDHRAMPDYLRLADVVVSTSEHETQSLVYLEAQATGRCLVASDVPAAREVVRDGETGRLFRPGDVQALGEALVAAAADPEWRATIGRAARRRVRGHALPLIAERYERVLAALAAAAPDGGRPRAR